MSGSLDKSHVYNFDFIGYRFIYDHCIADAKEYADEINAIFTETSALTAINIKELFEKIGK